MKESTIERAARLKLHAKGALMHKLTASLGDPDRLVVWRDNKGVTHAFYVEMKQPGNTRQKIQKLRAKQLPANVYTCTSVAECLAALETEKR